MHVATRYVLAVAILLTTAGGASAAMGKKTSTGSVAGSGIVADYPLITTALTVPVPQSYKSKSNFLKVTTTYRAGCFVGDVLMSRIMIDGQTPHDTGFPFERYNEVDSDFGIVTKVYVLDPESLGGPAIAADSSVDLQLTSDLGIGCAANQIRMVVEALK